MAAKAKLARDTTLLKFHFEKLLADIKTGEDLAPADLENNESFHLNMDKIEDRWVQYDAVQGEVYGAILVDRQAETMSLLEQTDDLCSCIVAVRYAEKKKRGREWQLPFPTLAAAEGEGKEEMTGDPAGGRLAIAIQAIKQHQISNLIEKVQQQDTTIRTQQQLLAAQQQSAELRIKTLEDLAAIRDRPAADPARPHRAHIKIPQLIF